MVVLRYCYPMEIQCAMQEPQNSTVNILDVVAIVDASDHTPYYHDEIRELALMDDRYGSKLLFDGHDFANFQYQYFSTSESMLILCGIKNKFVLVQNVILDQVSREYYIIYVKEIFVA
jgi:hypothetical protein